jgi:hypothetical protein
MSITFTELYADRCITKGDKLVPHFWQPQPLASDRFTLFGDATQPVDPCWGVDSVLERIRALGLSCEIPVGQFILDASKRDLPDDATIHPLLKSNVTDEAKHEQGFKLAAEVYPVSNGTQAAAQSLTDIWQCLDEHPIVCAAALEVGVFLCSLGALRLFGGRSLSLMAAQIARDEYRHVGVNRGIMAAMGLDFSHDVTDLIDTTVGWLFRGLSIPKERLGLQIDMQFFIDSSRQLVQENRATELDNLVNYANQNSPMEMKNSSLYTRTIYVDA